MNTFARTAYALARDGILPAPLARTHPKHQTPVTAIVLALLLIVAVMAPIAALTSTNGLTAYSYVSTPGIVLIIAIFIATNLLLGPLYRRHHRERVRRGKTRGNPGNRRPDPPDSPRRAVLPGTRGCTQMARVYLSGLDGARCLAHPSSQTQHDLQPLTPAQPGTRSPPQEAGNW